MEHNLRIGDRVKIINDNRNMIWTITSFGDCFGQMTVNAESKKGEYYTVRCGLTCFPHHLQKI